MEADFWHQRWAANEIGFHQNQINPYLQRYWSALAIPRNEQVLVPLCGKSLDMLWLAEQGYQVVGIELSEIAVESFFKEQNIAVDKRQYGELTVWTSHQIKIYCGDFFQLNAADLKEVRGIYDRAALVALPPDMRQRYVEHLRQNIQPATQILLLTMTYDQELVAGPPFSISNNDVNQLYGARFMKQCLCSEMQPFTNPKFIEKGATHFSENVYHLIRL